MQEIKLDMTIEDINLVLEGLGSMPFARVYALVAKVQEQASQQLKPANVSRLEPAAASRAMEG